MNIKSIKTIAVLLTIWLTCSASVAEQGKLIYSKKPLETKVQTKLSARLKKTIPGITKGIVSKTAYIGKCGNYSVAIDSDTPDNDVSKLTILRIDLTGKNDFTNAAVIKCPLKKAHDYNTYYCWHKTGNVAAKVNGQDVTLFADINYNVYKTRGQPNIRLTLSASATGECKFGNKVYPITFVDSNHDFAFNAKPTQHWTKGLFWIKDGDWYQLDTPSGKVKGWVGSPVRVDGKWWTISNKGMTVSAKPFAGKFGKVNFESKTWSATFVSENYVFKIPDQAGSIEVPAGTYRLTEYIASNRETPEDKGPLLKSTNCWLRKTFTINPGEDFTLKIGKTIHMLVLAKKAKPGKLMFAVCISDVLENYTSIPHDKNGKTPRAPRLQIFDATGKLLKTVNMHYG